MTRDELIKLLFQKGELHNISDMEVYMLSKSSMDINIYNGELEKYVVSDEKALSLRGIYNGKMGYSYTEKLLSESLDELIDNLKQYAEKNDNTELESISSPKDGDKKYIKKINLLDKYTEEEKIEYILDLEKKAYALDSRVKTKWMWI